MSHQTLMLLLNASLETLYMVAISSAIAVLVGIPLGVFLLTSRRGGILENRPLNFLLGAVTNVLRSIPFIILIVAIIPLTRFLVGTSIGTTAAIVPLSIGAIPFVARIIENVLEEVPKGLIEAGHALGASPEQIIMKFLLPEALPGIINATTITVITLIGYSAMAGAVGAGGLGDIAIRYGYQRFDMNIMLATIVILVVMVQIFQWLGDGLAKLVSHS